MAEAVPRQAAEIEGIEFLARDLQEFVCKDLPDAGRRRGTFQVPVGGYDEQAGFCFTGRAWRAPSLRPQWQRGGKAMRMNKLVGAIMVAGCMGLAGAAHAVSVEVSYTGDNEVTGFWITDDGGNVVENAFVSGGNNGDWEAGTTQTVSNLAVGEYYFVFRNENRGKKVPPENGPAAFLAAITGTVEEPVYTGNAATTGTVWEFSEGSCDSTSCPSDTSDWKAAELTDGKSGNNLDSAARFGDQNNVWEENGNTLSESIFENSYWIWNDKDQGANGDALGEGLVRGQVFVTPIPPAALLFGSALIGLGVIARRRRAARNEQEPAAA